MEKQPDLRALFAQHASAAAQAKAEAELKELKDRIQGIDPAGDAERKYTQQAQQRDDDSIRLQRGRELTELETLVEEVSRHPDVRDDDLLYHLAEECAETAVECMKLAKVIRSTDPTDAMDAKVASLLAEEMGDIENIFAVIRARMDVPAPFNREKKMRRWIGRLKENADKQKKGCD